MTILYRSHLLNYPDNVLGAIISNLKETSDLIQLGRTNRLLNYHCNKALYSSILIKNDNTTLSKVENYSADFTTLPTQNYNSFIQTLYSNKTLVSFISKVAINVLNLDEIQNLELLTDLLNSYKGNHSNVPLLGLREFTVNLLTGSKAYNFIHYNKEYLNSRKMKASSSCKMLYENDEDEFNQYDRFSFNNGAIATLESYQLNNLDELNELPVQTCSLSLNNKTKYRQTNQLALTPQLTSVFENLKSLELVNAQSTASFFTESICNKVTFTNLINLSVNLNDLLLLESIAKCVNIQNLKTLEFKFKQSVINEWDYEYNLQLVDFLYSNLKNIEKLSIVHLNSNNLMKNSSTLTEYSFKDSNFSFCLINNFKSLSSTSNIKYLNLSSNNFSLIPQLSSNYADSKTHFIIDDSYLSSKAKLFSNILNLKSLETLIIPDFFYNWKPFFDLKKDGSISLNKSLDTTSFLFNNCHCSNCASARQLMFSYTTKFAPPSPPTSPLSSSDQSPFDKGLSPVYNFLVSMLHRRHPSLDTNSTINMDSSAYLMLDSVRLSHYGYLGIDMAPMVSLILDNLIPDLIFFSCWFRDLKDICLGGITLKINRDGNQVEVKGVYDDWKTTFQLPDQKA